MRMDLRLEAERDERRMIAPSRTSRLATHASRLAPRILAPRTLAPRLAAALIGNTPLVRLEPLETAGRRASTRSSSAQNPGGSVEGPRGGAR